MKRTLQDLFSLLDLITLSADLLCLLLRLILCSVELGLFAALVVLKIGLLLAQIVQSLREIIHILR